MIFAAIDASEVLVLFGGLGAIGLVLWYFFGTRQQVAANVTAEGVQAVRVTVKGGYSPDVIVVEKGKPVRLEFDREETSSCSEELRFPEFGIARNLPAFKTTNVTFTPDRTGEFEFTCGMGMIRGKLVVR